MYRGRSICMTVVVGLLASLALGATIARGAVRPVATRVDFTASTSLNVDRMTGLYSGSLIQTRVTPTRPRNARVPRSLASATRAACIRRYVTGKNKRPIPAVRLWWHRGGGAYRTNATWGNAGTTFDGSGRWTQMGIVSSSIQNGEKITAEGGFWGDGYNYLLTHVDTRFRYGSGSVTASCWSFSGSRRWPF
ncbi:MAG: hypothetical protein QOI91_1704 [Solirubrobacteraceae bacterium]|nr:hypothetical protein [Solirubrobacteraceae bacterium]